MTDAITIGVADLVKIAGTGSDPPVGDYQKLPESLQFRQFYQFFPN
jgi:hypothetical protein